MHNRKLYSISALHHNNKSSPRTFHRLDKMRCSSSAITAEYLPILIQLKSLPESIRREIALDILPKSDDSIASTADGKINDGTTLNYASLDDDGEDVRRWVECLDDHFEPMLAHSGDDYDAEGADELVDLQSNSIKSMKTGMSCDESDGSATNGK
jgi:hypothetical protein